MDRETRSSKETQEPWRKLEWVGTDGGKAED